MDKNLRTVKEGRQFGITAMGKKKFPGFLLQAGYLQFKPIERIMKLACELRQSVSDSIRGSYYSQGQT